ncbi:MAG: glutathione binding-like protein, partial [Alphaproteobacteria bacterium]
IPIDSRLGDQHKPEYLAINPNAKAPSLIDGDVTLFDSNAILLYLAEKTGEFIPEGSGPERGEMLSWLMFVATGIGPYSGQSVHFQHHAPEKLEYAINRYRYEAKRHYQIIDNRLKNQSYMLGEQYSIIDMAVWGWATRVGYVLDEQARDAMPHLKRLVEEISSRPAALRVQALVDAHSFKMEMDEDARRNMFPSNLVKV